jgi:hydrogenase maturation protease
MSSGDRPTVLVAAIGNPDRGDDGFGPTVASRLRGRPRAGVRVVERNRDVLALIDEWARFSAVIVVDAAAPISRPGRIHRLDLAGQPLPAAFARSSTHALGVAEAVELARSLGQLPRHLVAYLVEGERFDIGTPLSPAVAKAVGKVVECILAETSRISAPRQLEGAAKHA